MSEKAVKIEMPATTVTEMVYSCDICGHSHIPNRKCALCGRHYCPSHRGDYASRDDRHSDYPSYRCSCCEEVGGPYRKAIQDAEDACDMAVDEQMELWRKKSLEQPTKEKRQ